MEKDLQALKDKMNKEFLEFDSREVSIDENGDKVYGDIKYIIWVSKKFYGELPEEFNSPTQRYNYNIVRDSLGFYPQFHDIIPFNLCCYLINFIISIIQMKKLRPREVL